MAYCKCQELKEWAEAEQAKGYMGLYLYRCPVHIPPPMPQENLDALIALMNKWERERPLLTRIKYKIIRTINRAYAFYARHTTR